MKLNLSRETLLKPLQMVIGVVERKQTLPILSNVLLNLKDNKLSVMGTDLEVELVGQADMGQNIETNEQLTLPGRKLMDICKALPEGAPIELYQDNERVILKSGRSRFVLTTLPASDFPSVEEQEGNLTFTIKQQDLRQLLQRTAFSMAQQDVRYYLNGLLLEIRPSLLRAVATDGHRLATSTMDIHTDTEHRLQIIIPRKGVFELTRLLNDSDMDVSVTIGSNHIRVSSNDYTFTSKLVEGRFPDYERVIPKNSDKTITIDRDALKNALSRASILCNEKFRGIRLELKDNTLKMLANNPEHETAEEELSISYDKEPLDIGFNVTYLLDILNALNPGNVTLMFADANSSLLIKEADADNNSVFVVMPMRL